MKLIAQRIDHWIGKTLFVPLIIRVCQRLGISQYRFHNYGWLIGSYFILAQAIKSPERDESLPFALALFLTVMYGRNLDNEGHEGTFLRRMFILTNALHIIAHATGSKMLLAGPNWDLSCPVGLIWLAAEYARTIKTIPPLEAKQGTVTVLGRVAK